MCGFYFLWLGIEFLYSMPGFLHRSLLELKRLFLFNPLFTKILQQELQLLSRKENAAFYCAKR